MVDGQLLILLRQGADAWNAWRRQHTAVNPDLSGANLSGVNLAGAVLAEADLSRANLSAAVLDRTDLTKTNLSMANLTGASLGDADASEARLGGAFLGAADLSRATLRSADLSGANLGGAYLRGATLSGANLRGADLRRASLIAATLGGANLSLADFTEANLSRAVLSGADLSGANLNKTNLSLADLSNAELTNVIWQFSTMRGCYLGIRGLDSCYGNALFRRAAADQDFLDALEAHLKDSWREALFWAWGLINYGRSLFRVAILALGLAAVYGTIYKIFPETLNYKESAQTWFTPYYFSIVTYTTLGFGDVKPANLAGEIIVTTEVILGYTTLGLLLAVLGENIARRS
jgi:uncharacterized protein YjbI with pentapeptide repeats